MHRNEISNTFRKKKKNPPPPLKTLKNRPFLEKRPVKNTFSTKSWKKNTYKPPGNSLK